MQTLFTLLVSLFLPSALALPNPASHISVGSIFELGHDSGRFIREAGDGDELAFIDDIEVSPSDKSRSKESPEDGERLL